MRPSRAVRARVSTGSARSLLDAAFGGVLVGTVAFVLMHFGVDSVQHARRWVGLDPLQPLPGGAAEVAFAYPVPCAALFFGSLYLTFRSGSLRA